MYIFISVMFVILGCDPIYGMHIAITDENNNMLLPYCINNEKIKNFKSINACLDDVGSIGNVKLAAECHEENFVPLPLKDINTFVQASAGIDVNVQHIKHALNYLTTDYEKNKFPAIDAYSMASAVFLCDYYGINNQIIKKNLAQTALHNGYTNMVYAYINTLKKNEAKNINNINNASDALLKLYEGVELAKEDYTTLYEDMYASCAFTSLEQNIDQLPDAITDIDLMNDVYEQFDQWRNDLPTRLFDMFHQRSIGRKVCHDLNVEYASSCKNIMRETERKRFDKLLDNTRKSKELFSIHDMYLFYNSCIYHNSYNTHMFTHIPLRYACMKLDNKLHYNYDRFYYKNFYCNNIQDFVLLDIDKVFLKKFKKLPNNPDPEIFLHNCQLATLPLNKAELQSLHSIHLYLWKNPLQSEARQCIKNIGYRNYYEDKRYSYPKKIESHEKYEIMPRYWPWLKLGSGILFAGCTAALCYYLYKNAQKACAITDLHLNTRAAYVRNDLLSKVSKDTVDAYKLASYNTHIPEGESSKTITDTLMTIDPKPINGSTHYILNANTYWRAVYALRDYESFWNNYSSYADIWSSTLLKMTGTIMYGTIAAIKQFRRFLYGPKPYLNNEISYNLNQRSPFGKPFEPFLLIETMFGLNKPNCTITIDKEEL